MIYKIKMYSNQLKNISKTHKKTVFLIFIHKSKKYNDKMKSVGRYLDKNFNCHLVKIEITKSRYLDK